MKLYVAVCNWYEVYSSFLGACSADKEIVESYLTDWLKNYRQSGCAAEGFIQEVEVDSEIVKVAHEAADAALYVELKFSVKDKIMFDRVYPGDFEDWEEWQHVEMEITDVVGLDLEEGRACQYITKDYEI